MSEDATGSDLGGSTSSGPGGGSTGAGATAGAAVASPSPNGGAVALRGLRSGLPLPVHDHETPATGGELDDYLRTAWATDHLTPGADAHPEYATDVGLAAVQAGLAAVYTEEEADARFEQLTRKGAADGYAPLDAGGLVPTVHLPPLAVTDTFAVASEAAMLALDAQVGDICVRSDLGKTFILAAVPAATLANWLEMAAAGQVVSVNGETGVVALTAADVGAAASDHTHPSEESGQWRFQNNPTVADPGSGYLRSNTGVLSTATVLVISRTTQDGYDIPPPGFGVAGGDTILLQDRDDSTKWVRYTADEPLSRFATYATGAVTVTGSAGTIAHGQIVQVVFSLAGGGGGGATDYLTEDEADALYLPLAHAAAADVHHAQGHNHTTGDSSGVLTNEEHDGYSQYANLGADPSTPATNRIRLYSKDNGSGVATLYYISESGQVYELPTLTTGGGGGGSGAPANATYVTLAAETKLSGETALGAGVIMAGTAASRPAAATAGRLHWSTDTGVLARDSGSAWVEVARAETAVRLAQLADVTVGTPADGDVLTYDTGAGEWQAAAPAGGGGSLATDALADAKGDVFAASGANAVGRLPVGTNGHVLTADSAEALGVKWAAGGGGGTSGLVKLSQTVLGSAQASITFSSIAQTYDTLVVEVVGRCDQAGTGAATLYARFNGDAGGTNYDAQYIKGSGAVGSAGTNNWNVTFVGTLPQASAAAGVPGITRFEIPYYAGTTFQKALIGIDGTRTTATAVEAFVGLWRSTAAITTILLTPSGGNFVTGTRATLYGIV